MKRKDKAAPVEETPAPQAPAKSKPRRMRVETAAALAHLLGPVTALFFLATDSRAEVRLQAWQSLVFSVVVILASLLLYYSLIGILLLPPLFLATLLVWLSAIWRAAASANSARPWPTLTFHSAARPSMYVWPSTSVSVAPSPLA